MTHAKTLAPAHILTYRASSDGVYLELDIDHQPEVLVVVAARGNAETIPDAVGPLKAICDLVPGLPLEEAADHAVIRVLPKFVPARSLPGILTPRSAGPAFRLIEGLLRRIHADALAHGQIKARANFYVPVLPSSWSEKDEATQIATLSPLIARKMPALGLPADGLTIETIERGLRVFAVFNESVPSHARAATLRAIEPVLRQAVGARLELYLVEMKDKNTIRRDPNAPANQENAP